MSLAIVIQAKKSSSESFLSEGSAFDFFLSGWCLSTFFRTEKQNWTKLTINSLKKKIFLRQNVGSEYNLTYKSAITGIRESIKVIDNVQAGIEGFRVKKKSPLVGCQGQENL